MNERLDENGFEILDPTPVARTTSLRMPQNSVIRMRNLIRQEMSLRAAEEGQESFEEADDFEIEGEEWVSPYEAVFEPQVEDSPPPLPDSGGVADKTDASTASEPTGSDDANP